MKLGIPFARLNEESKKGQEWVRCDSNWDSFASAHPLHLRCAPNWESIGTRACTAPPLRLEPRLFSSLAAAMPRSRRTACRASASTTATAAP
eukprot:1963472-Prymnesium_polylepis.1